MTNLLRAITCTIGLLATTGCASQAIAPLMMAGAPPAYIAPEPLHLMASTIRSYTVPDADQGVAVDEKNFYAIDNTVIAKHALATGDLVARFAAPKAGLIRHMNSCLATRGTLVCANSNYSLTPMGSSIETFDAQTLQHVSSHGLGMTDEGSLTWLDNYRGGWIAGFAHYDENGGLGFKDHRFSGVVTFDDQWRRTGGWLIPDSVLARMAPHAASGGAFGPDGLLYVLGHDRPELYVLAKPVMGPTLIHVATIDIEAEGQAFSWAPGKRRTIYAIDRRKGRVMAIDIPAVDLGTFVDARVFR